jgi:hypothetical protein
MQALAAQKKPNITKTTAVIVELDKAVCIMVTQSIIYFSYEDSEIPCQLTDGA